MPHISSLPKDYNELTKIISGLRKDISQDKAREIADNFLFKNQGTGSLVKDFLFKKKKSTSLDGLQRELSNIDIHGGKILHDVINTDKDTKIGKVRKNIAKNFLVDLDVNHGSLKDNPEISDFSKVKVPLLTAPAGKVKKSILPLAGSFAIADHVFKNTPKKDGDAKLDNEKKEIVQKIASYCVDSKLASDKTTKLLKQASFAVNEVLDKYLILKESYEKLASENAELFKANEDFAQHFDFLEREKLAKEVVNEMIDKKIIRKKEIDEKIAELTNMNNEAFLQFKEAVSAIEKNDAEKYGADNLQFLLLNDNIESRKENMLDLFSK